ncbi:hypothetical protein TSTA_107420 [Talaromyces stipitatus ATCC 10500]|uniref:Uncharacterized protein n=1 Tax=Talaromyces stipitatus (strain ATCC 10500 / CBS 375.48 / QM 6759 / NRRL 1006) TaxID=441959 RepID=B8MN86_TALSN|nr:uncharacterized protein TSTA_107420 [Talaromyces stipitatus ATCC 10500]EED14535.1 hypothetical protein TSTA_107420 [Talaromyces stipitatus ATCC 10500]
MAFRTSAAANCRTLTKVHQVAERWERTHASKFAPAKYQLTHFWRKHQMVPKPRGRLDVPLIIKGVEIKPVDSIKYLRVYLDTHLTGEVHIQEMREKAAKLIMYTCSTWYIQGGRGFTGAQRAAEQAI